tara:strand:+ start:2224 stop:2694 length:471 start_codon:yes stop_codon:yes gene_type:complete
MKKLIYILMFCIISQTAFGAGSDSSDSNTYLDKYKSAKNLVNRGKKLEEKGKTEKALKLYNSAYKQLLEAYKIERRNPDILNYLGFTLRKTGNFEQAEKYYLQGLEIKPDHNGINEYLGELYIQTNRIDKAKERLAVLQNCNCEEYNELKTLIEKN